MTLICDKPTFVSLIPQYVVCEARTGCGNCDECLVVPVNCFDVEQGRCKFTVSLP